MDIFNLNIATIPLIGLLKILLEIFNLLAEKGNSEFQRGTAAKNEYSAKCGKNTALFINDLRGKTVNFLKNNFKEEDLIQILGKQEVMKEEPPKQTQNRGYGVR
jgi:hypothetical protein